MSPDLALLSALIGSNYPCLELIFMVPKVFKPLKFDCTFISSANSRKAVVSYWQKYVHKVLVNRLEVLSLPRKSVVKLTDLSCLPWT